MSCRRLWPILAGALLLALPALAETFTGRVVGVTDGDTVTVLRQTPQGPRPAKIRLYGVDAPESRQAFGARAKQYTSAQAFGKTAQVDVRDTDRYGRLVAVVTVGGRSVNAELVRAGLAWWYRKYAPQDSELERIETDARRDRRGLWADATPVPPWEWRRRAAPAPTPSSGQTGAVYVTRTGTAYHRAGCVHAARATGTVSRADAARRGLTPCRMCRP